MNQLKQILKKANSIDKNLFLEYRKDNFQEEFIEMTKKLK